MSKPITDTWRSSNSPPRSFPTPTLASTNPPGVPSSVKILFNGELVGESAPKPAGVVDVDGSIMVGARHPGSEFFAGVIDDVAIYNRVLSDAEIARDMEAVGGAAVEAYGKLASTWGELKKR